MKRQTKNEMHSSKMRNMLLITAYPLESRQDLVLAGELR